MQSVWKGLELTIYGMGLVFLILAVLAGLIALLIRLDRPSKESDPAPTPDAASGAGTGTSSVAAVPAFVLTPELTAAVVIACRAHRMSRRKQAAPEMRTHEPGSLPSRWVGSGRTRQNRSWAPGGRYS